jgi:hypothetical protein
MLFSLHLIISVGPRSPAGLGRRHAGGTRDRRPADASRHPNRCVGFPWRAAAKRKRLRHASGLCSWRCCRKGVRTSDPILGNDPNAAYDVVPTQGWPQGWTVTCNGISVRHFVNKTNAERYATNAEYRASLIVAKYADR